MNKRRRIYIALTKRNLKVITHVENKVQDNVDLIAAFFVM